MTKLTGTLSIKKKPLKAIITVGIPASGKSTWARHYCLSENTNAIEVNRDNIRGDLFNNGYPIDWNTYKFSKQKEDAVTDEVWKRIRVAAENKNDIVISDTNLNPDRVEHMIVQLNELGYVCEIKHFPISFEEACKRDASRPNGVGYSVIARMKEQYDRVIEQYHDKYVHITSARDAKGAYIFDIDGTLAIMKDRSPFEWDKVGQDDVNTNVANVARALHKAGHKIIILSGRDSICREETFFWLKDKNIPFDKVFMRARKDFRKDSVVKEELLEKYVLPTYNILGVFDDRPSVCRMWRSLGLEVFQIGNPYVEF